jgi:8-oxo-dGTP diphosphatase
METTRVGIAIVEHEGRFLVGVRQADQVLAGKAEFPGGKCEPGETVQDCAARECLEETGVPVVAERLLERTGHEYEHGRVDLEFWLCRVASDNASESGGTVSPIGSFRWCGWNELATLDFPDANRRVIEQLVADSR